MSKEFQATFVILSPWANTISVVVCLCCGNNFIVFGKNQLGCCWKNSINCWRKPLIVDAFHWRKTIDGEKTPGMSFVV
jgi:hypothetical protein